MIVLTDGGPYVSADDVPEQAEIHPLRQLPGGGYKLSDRDGSALPGSS